jgi:hypothetical protein
VWLLGYEGPVHVNNFAKNIIDTAFSFEGRGGATVFFEHVNFQPRASKARNVYFLQNGPYY